MTSDVDHCGRRVFAYAATRGELGFDQKKLEEMVRACAYRHELLRTDLKPGELKRLHWIVGKERLDLWI
jgi:hypothetical protein